MHAGYSGNVLGVFWWTKTKKTSGQSLLVAENKSGEKNRENIRQEKNEMKIAATPGNNR